jgi:multiple sugar transport system substrate-binding protein
MRAIFLAVALVMAPLDAKAADLVVWWEKGYYPQEDEALAEITATFEQNTGKQVEVTFYEDRELPAKIVAALEVGRPPDFAYGIELPYYVAQWALDDRLIDLTGTVGAFSNMFDPDALDRGMWRNAKTGQKALYALPIGRSTDHLHVWKSLLQQAGFTLADIPKEWEPFWSFWCDQVQPAVRRAAGRDDIWGIGLPMSAEAADTWIGFFQFVGAYEADYVTPDGRLVIDDPEIRQGLIQAMDGYTAIYKKGCTPPDSVTWGPFNNNQQFLDGTVVMTPNDTLSIPNALKRDRPDDYYKNVATIEWPLGMRGQPFRIVGFVFPGVVFKDGGNLATAEAFVRFLVSEGWLMHYLNFSGERLLPTITKLLDQPFWLARATRTAWPQRSRSKRGRWPTTTPWRRATGGTTWSSRNTSGNRRSTVSPRTGSAPSRRSTRRSPGSSRSCRSEGHASGRPKPSRLCDRSNARHPRSPTPKS